MTDFCNRCDNGKRRKPVGVWAIFEIGDHERLFWAKDDENSIGGFGAFWGMSKSLVLLNLQIASGPNVHEVYI